MNCRFNRADTHHMTTVYGKALLIIAAIAHCIWAWRTVDRRLSLRPKRDQWMGALLMPAAIMIFALAANALAFLSQAMLEQELGWMEGGYGSDGSAEPPTWWDSFRTQMSVFGGTCMLMWMVRAALTRPEIYEGEHPRVAGVLAQKLMIQRLVVRHWLAVVGFGVVFGVASGPGIVMLLAVELTIMWLGAHFGLKYFRGALIDNDEPTEASPDPNETASNAIDDRNRDRAA